MTVRLPNRSAKHPCLLASIPLPISSFRTAQNTLNLHPRKPHPCAQSHPCVQPAHVEPNSTHYSTPSKIQRLAHATSPAQQQPANHPPRRPPVHCSPNSIPRITLALLPTSAQNQLVCLNIALFHRPTARHHANTAKPHYAKKHLTTIIKHSSSRRRGTAPAYLAPSQRFTPRPMFRAQSKEM